jgi:hypothetical protein
MPRMQRIYTALDPALVAHLEGLLKQAGIETRVFNQTISNAVGDLPFTAAGPELWVMYEADAPRATELIARFEAERDQPDAPRGDWVCPTCGERIGGQFTACWNCTIEDDSDPRQDPNARCAVCHYPLRGLPERRCPECGTEF